MRRLVFQYLFLLCAFVCVHAGRAEPQSAEPKQVLFICTGNFYRSRFAEAFFNQKAEEEHLGWHAVSRGLRIAASQHGVSPIAKRELLKRGVPQEFFRGNPKPLTKEDLDKSDYIVLLDETEHRPMLEKLFLKRDDHKIHYWHIHDTGKMKPAVACPAMADEIEKLIREIDR